MSYAFPALKETKTICFLWGTQIIWSYCREDRLTHVLLVNISFYRFLN